MKKTEVAISREIRKRRYTVADAGSNFEFYIFAKDPLQATRR